MAEVVDVFPTRPANEPMPASVPSRARPDEVALRRWIPRALATRLFGAPLEPSPSEWAVMKAALSAGDPAMDTIVAWMFDERASERKAMFERALSRGIDAVEDAPPELRRFFVDELRDPPWLDRALLEEGVRASQLPGETAVLVLRDLALMGGYVYFNTMNQTLARAGALTKDTSRRIGETGKWIEDVTEPYGLERHGIGFVSTVRVRMIHALIRRHVGARADWDASRWGLPINQVDMLSTYLAFGPVTLLGARLLGVPIRARQAAAIMHLWRYVGFLSGVEDRFLAVTEGDGLRKLFHTSLTHRRPDETTRLLGQALMREPLGRAAPSSADLPWLASLRRRFDYHKHLSNSALILDPFRRRALGLPLFTLPWYPILSAPLRFVRIGYHQWRGGDVLERYLARTREEQKRHLDTYFGGSARALIEPAPSHPAYVARGTPHA